MKSTSQISFMARVFTVAGLCGVASLMALAGCTKKPDLNQAKGQYSYAIGVQIAQNLKNQNIKIDPVAFAAGVDDVFSGRKLRLNRNDRMEALRQMSEGLQKEQLAQAQENLKKGQEFLATNKTKPGWKVTASGLQYKMVRKGKGPRASKDDTVVVNYEGKLIDGKVFDSSYKRGQPATFPVGAVIPGWTEALQLMRAGSEYKLAIPPDLAYGPRGNAVIPPDSVLLFKVELLKILPKGKPAHRVMRHHRRK